MITGPKTSLTRAPGFARVILKQYVSFGGKEVEIGLRQQTNRSGGLPPLFGPSMVRSFTVLNSLVKPNRYSRQNSAAEQTRVKKVAINQHNWEKTD